MFKKMDKWNDLVTHENVWSEKFIFLLTCLDS